MSEQQWLAGILRQVWAPRPEEKIWQWAERRLKLHTGESTDNPGPYRSSLTPYVRSLLEWVTAPGDGELFVVKSSQVGLTLSFLVAIAYFVENQPRNVIYAIDSTPEARRISKIRLQPLLVNNNLLASTGAREDDLSNLTYYLPGMTVYLMGAFSRGAFANKNAGLAILDEIEKHPVIEGEGTTVDLMRERLKAVEDSKLVAFSTPTGEQGQLWREYLHGTQEKVHVACPHCGHRQELLWERVQFGHCKEKDLAGEEIWDLNRVEAETWYKCELGCRIEEREKFDLLQTGEWVATNQKPQPRKRSAQISDLYSPFCTWGRLAGEWVAAMADQEKLRRFYNGRLGLPFKESLGDIREDVVLKLRGAYRRGTCPVVPDLLCMAVDVQADCQKWAKVAWTVRGDMWVCDYGATLSMDELDDMADMPVEIPGGEMTVRIALMDEGHRAMDVRRWCLARVPRWWPVKGRAGLQVRHTVATSSTWVDGDELLVYHIDDDSFKRQLYHGYIKGGEKARRYNQPTIHLPEDIDPDFVRELMGEKLQLPKTRKGYDRPEWIKTGTNDYGDVLKYTCVIWAVLGPLVRSEVALRDKTEAEPPAPVAVGM